MWTVATWRHLQQISAGRIAPEHERLSSLDTNWIFELNFSDRKTRNNDHHEVGKMKIRDFVTKALLVPVVLLPFVIFSSPGYGKDLDREWKDGRTQVKCKVVRSDRKNSFVTPSPAISKGNRMVSAPLVSLKEARAYYDKRIKPKQKDLNQKETASGIFAIPWGQEEEKLAHGLGCYDDYQTADPVKIYEFVRNHIDYEPSFGFVKGGEMTLLDGCGNAFDQASLLIDLLMIAGHKADYVYGIIHLTGEQFIHWMGIDDNPVLAYELLSDAGIPANVYASNGRIDHVDMQHMWVKLWAPDGSFDSYALDPSFKEYRVTDGIDIGAAMGYDRTAFLSRATEGMTITSDYLQNLNRANIRADLTGYSSNLGTYIESNFSGKGMDEIIGGREIIPLTGQPLTETLPYEVERFYEYNGYFEGRDWGLSTMVTITYQGWDHLFPAFDIYGERLTLSFTEESGVYTAYLFLDGILMNDFPVTEPTEPLQIYIDHPYMANGGTYQDDIGFVSPKPGIDNLYYFCFGFGKTGRKALEKHRKTLQEFMLDSTTPDSEPNPVLGEALSLLGLTWMAETSRATEIGDALAGTRTLRHHSCGIMGQEASPMMDMPMSSTSVAGTDSNIKFGRFFTRFVTNSAFEGGAIAQIYGGQGASTVSLLDLANLQGNKIFDADSSNYSTIVKPQLQGYTPAYLAALDGHIAQGDRLILSEHGDLQMGDYLGAGYFCLSDGYYQTLILGGLSGGYGTRTGVLDPDATGAGETDYENPEDHPQSKEPIDFFTGYYVMNSVDLSVGGSRMPFGLSLVRAYNSGACKRDGPLGLGWSHNLDIQAAAGSDGFRGMGAMSPVDAAPVISAIFVASDIFSDTLPFDRILLSTVVNQWLMESLVDNVVNITVRHGSIQFVKMPDGGFRPQPGKWAQLEKETDGSFLMTTKHGNKFDFGLDGRLSTWQDPNANTVTFEYSDGYLSSVSNGLGKSLHFNYNAQQRISEVTDHTGRAVTYTYDSLGNLIHAQDPELNQTTYEYDVPGRLTRIYNPSDTVNPYVVNEYIDGDDIAKFRYQPMQVISQADPSGNVSSYYFAAGRRSEEVDPGGNARIYEFNRAGCFTKHGNPLGFVTTSDYDGLGRLVKMTLPEGNGREISYGHRDNVSQVSFFPKTGSGEMPRVYQFTYDVVFDKLKSMTDPLGRLKTYEYDSRGNLITLQYPEADGVIPTYHISVNSRGQAIRIENPLGMITSVSYEGSSALPSGVTTDDGGLQQTISIQYDAVGNPTYVTDPLGNTAAFEYDDNRYPVLETSPAPFNYQTAYGLNPDRELASISKETGIPADPWQTIQISYDTPNAQNAIIDPQGRTTTFMNNETRKLWRIRDNAGNVTEAQYDARGKAYRLIDALGSISEEHAFTANGKRESLTDANGNMTTYEYDDFDRLSKMTFPDSSFMTYTYDAKNHLTGLKTRAGEHIAYEYNALDQLTLKTLPDASTIRYESDLLGRLTRTTSSRTGVITFAYDDLNRLVSVTHPGSKTFSYEYDLASNLTKITYPDGYYVTYSYDELKRVTRIDENGTTLLVQYTYDPLSRRTQMSYGNGVSVDYTYDASDSVLTIDYHFRGESVNLSYAYDTLGNLASFTTENPSFLYSPPAGSDIDYFADTLNQYTSVNGTPYSYDANGNLVSDGVNTYGYDAENQLISVITPEHTITFEYNALKQRIKKAVDGVATTYLYSGLNLFAEYDHEGNLMKRYIYGPRLDSPVMLKTGSGDYYYHQDRIRSVVALSDASGDIAEIYGYSPFGDPDRLSAVGNSMMFTGREYDAESRLYYYRARYYSPDLGRFLSPDPVGYTGGGVNLYTYVSNDPVNFTDGLGLSWNFPGDGYVDHVKGEIQRLRNKGRFEQANELELIVKQLTEYGEFMNANPGTGNCVVTNEDFQKSEFAEPLKDLKYYEVKEIAGSFKAPATVGPEIKSKPKGSFEHFAMTVGPKGSTDINEQVFIYDPVGQPLHNHNWFGGQIDGFDRSHKVENAIRDPGWWQWMLPGNYSNATVYMGNDPDYVHPVILGPSRRQ